VLKEERRINEGQTEKRNGIERKDYVGWGLIAGEGRKE
jgi:hypothetical protein